MKCFQFKLYQKRTAMEYFNIKNSKKKILIKLFISKWTKKLVGIKRLNKKSRKNNPILTTFIVVCYEKIVFIL